MLHAACSLVVCLSGFCYIDKLKLGTFIFLDIFLQNQFLQRWCICAGLCQGVCVVCVGNRDARLHTGFCASVPQPPTITHQSPKDYIIDPRENIIIYCEAKGKPHPRWVSL